MMTRQTPIHLMQLRSRIEFVFQAEYAGLQVRRQLEPRRDPTRRIDRYQRAEIVLLLAIEEDHGEASRTRHRPGDVRRIR